MNVLILLLGGNPLPNYVTARYLLMKDREDTDNLPIPEKIVLISTKQTETYYDSILQVLEDDLGKDFCSHEEIKLKYKKYEMQRDPGFIRESIKKTLVRIENKDPIQSVHMNYTGGTKPMSVNGFIVVEEFSKTNRAEFVLSDLDPDDFKLKVSFVSSNHDVDWFPQEKDLRNFVKLDIEGILRLHNLELDRASGEPIFNKNEFDMNKFGQIMSKIYKNSDKNKKFLDLLSKFKKSEDIRELVKEFDFLSVVQTAYERDNIESGKIYSFLREKWWIEYDFELIKEKEFKMNQFGLNMAQIYHDKKKRGIFFKLLKEFNKSENMNALVREFDFLSVVQTAFEKEKIESGKIYNFLNGKWLEDYVFKILMELRNSGKININEMKKGIFANYEKREQELDLIVMKGYQLFLISCTTSQSITDVKPKLFEALYRAEQLGGEQSKIIMVSTMFNQYQGTKDTEKSNIEELDKELEQFEARKNCFLIGLDELTGKKSLSDLLENIIEYGGKQ